MSARGFGSLVTAATVVGTALGCYLISLKVASERAQLERVETEIVQTQRAIRLIETEIGTRGRLDQLEKWNANFMRMSAPEADQLLEGSFQLATMIAPPAKPAIEAPVVLAAASTEDRVAREGSPIAKEDVAEQAVSKRADEMLYQTSVEVQPRGERPAKDQADPLAPKKAPESSNSKVTGQTGQ